MNQTYGEIKLTRDKKSWVITGLPPHLLIKIKAMFPKLPKYTKLGRIVLKRNLENSRDLEWFHQRYPFGGDPSMLDSLTADAEEHKDTNNKIYSIINNETLEPVSIDLKPGLSLREYQSKFVQVVKHKKRMLLVDDVGLGKTISTIGAILAVNKPPAMVVMEPHLQNQWEEKIKEFSHLRVHKIKGMKPYVLPGADVYLMKYSCLIGWSDVVRDLSFSVMAFDEIQELRRNESQKYGVAKELADNSEYVFGLSATPIYNYGDEIYNILDLVSPGVLGAKEGFIREWCSNGKRVRNPKALGTFLQSEHLMLRRTMESVGREIPPVNTIVHTVDFDRKALDRIQERAEVLAITALKGGFVERGRAARDLDAMVRHATGVSKAKSVAKYVKAILDSGEKVLLAGWHRDVYDIWNRELSKYKPVMYTGSENQSQKDQSKKLFMEGDSKVMFISLRSGKGLDGLQHSCKYVVFGEFDWSPGVHTQVTGRIGRDGQQEKVNSIFLTSDSGSDPEMIEILGVKSQQSHGIINPLDSGPRQKQSDDSNVRKIVNKYAPKELLFKEQVTQ